MSFVAEMNIPAGVSPSLVQRLQKIQDQILVLIHNHEVTTATDLVHFHAHLDLFLVCCRSSIRECVSIRR